MANIARKHVVKECVQSVCFFSKRRDEKWAELLGIVSWSVGWSVKLCCGIRRVIIAAAARVIFITTGMHYKKLASLSLSGVLKAEIYVTIKFTLPREIIARGIYERNIFPNNRAQRSNEQRPGPANSYLMDKFYLTFG
jgi:hypothetical protein